ncbi:expressed unknown protein [Seminavis robusta]|uniref:Uncharacterized protein n=1 Tax=Seminavis robusta TaxID=568900 RepID=A0A9N8EWZ4_9STRA|nr:expressed unknown protein [Seminavis robusta]|eukprot:Sro2008_g310651.1  (206) ;mRNA; f:16178-16795
MMVDIYRYHLSHRLTNSQTNSQIQRSTFTTTKPNTKIMKTSAIFFLVAFATSQVNAGSLRNLNNCPQVPPNTICPALLDPIECGSSYGCHYNNDCLATAAGFNIRYCQKPAPACPLPGNNQCPRDINPVTCPNSAGGECTYDNACLAQASNMVNCSPVYEECRVPGRNRCSRENKPVLCGSQFHCQFDNECLAQAADYVNCIPAN